MRIFAILAFAFAALTLAPSALAATKPDRSECVRINKVRAFAVEDHSTIVVREGRSIYRRIELAGDCPLRSADRIGFAFGRNQLYVQARGGQNIPVQDGNITNRFCSATPHAYLVVIDDGDEWRTRCRINRISEAAEADFDAAHPKDNRY